MPSTIDLQNRIGGNPWLGIDISDLAVSWIKNASTSDLVDWCVNNGMPHAKAISLPRYTLQKCYCSSKAYFDTVAGLRPKKLKEIRREGERFRASLDVESSLDDPFASILSEATSVPIGAAPQIDPVQQLLDKVNQSVNEKIAILERATKTEVLNSLRTELETNTIELKLGKGLEGKILSLVQKAADEIVFQRLVRARVEEPVSEEENTENEDLLELPASNSQFIPKIDNNFYLDPYASRVARKALARGKHIYASGPTGCGKTTLFEQVCAIMQCGVFRINPHDGISRGFFLGEMKFISNETKFQYGALPIAMREGLLLLIDEFSFLPPALAAVMHPVMEPGGKLYIPETGEIIAPAPGFCVFATDNTGGKGDNSGQFVGTEVQNTATLDRFTYKLKMDYLPGAKEAEMLIKRFSIAADNSSKHLEINKLLSLASDIRNAFARGELAITFSTRKLIDYFEQRRDDGFSQGEALSNCLLSWLDEDDEQLVKTYLDRLEIKMED